jgi:pseudaminic acid biosynthesis-associated methylase
MNTEQEAIWSGEFGRDYTDRNKFESAQAFNAVYIERYGVTRDDMIRDWLSDVPKDARILEIGANIGNQLEALRRVGFTNLIGLELQRFCVEKSKSLHPQVDIIQGSGSDIPFRDGYFDLVFTNNVLIHISPDVIGQIIGEMYRVSNQYIWGFEYYAPEFTNIHYHGQSSLLWKADYAGLFQQQHPDLKLIRGELFNCLDEPGNVDKQYLLDKRS